MGRGLISFLAYSPKLSSVGEILGFWTMWGPPSEADFAAAPWRGYDSG